MEQDLDEDGRDYLVERMGPAVIACAVALATEEQERPGHRPPWHVLCDSFEPGTLAGHFRRLGSSLNVHGLGVCFTLEMVFRYVAEALGWNTRC